MVCTNKEESTCAYLNEIKALREENKKLKEKLNYHKKSMGVEQTMLEMIKNNKGSYEELSQKLYNTELNAYTFQSIIVTAYRLRKKGYKIKTVVNWGYKEG